MGRRCRRGESRVLRWSVHDRAVIGVPTCGGIYGPGAVGAIQNPHGSANVGTRREFVYGPSGGGRSARMRTVLPHTMHSPMPSQPGNSRYRSAFTYGP